MIKDLMLKANTIRELVIAMLLEAGSGHSAGSLGMADIFAALYFFVLKHDPHNPSWVARDRLILSNGHICPVQYATLALAGYFPLKELNTLRKINSRLQGHPHRGALPGLETSSGPLGEGLSQAIGMALARNLNQQEHYLYCVTSDGEHQEGNTWEAVMFAGKRKLHRFINIIDRNGIQIDGMTENIMPLEPLAAKYESFGWKTLSCDGNNIEQFLATVEVAKAVTNKPVVIIARTIPGKGVDFMENKFEWHGKSPSESEALKAISDLRSLGGKIEHD